MTDEEREALVQAILEAGTVTVDIYIRVEADVSVGGETKRITCSRLTHDWDKVEAAKRKAAESIVGMLLNRGWNPMEEGGYGGAITRRPDAVLFLPGG